MDLANIDPIWIVVAVAVIAVLVLLAAVARSRRQRRREQLRSRFGPEYERTVRREGSKKKAEQELAEREARHDRFQLRDLGEEDRERFRARWEALQTSFVDGPASAARAAETLLDDVARQRGYPDADPEQRLRDLSVDHPAEVDAYRRALPSASAKDRRRDDADAADSLRRRLLAARGLFDALVGGTGGVDAPAAPFDRDARDADRGVNGQGRHDDERSARGGSTVRHEPTAGRDEPTMRDDVASDEPTVGDEPVSGDVPHERASEVPPAGTPVADGVEPVGEPAEAPLDDAGAAPRSTERTVTPPPPPSPEDEPPGVLGPDGRPVERNG